MLATVSVKYCGYSMSRPPWQCCISTGVRHRRRKIERYNGVLPMYFARRFLHYGPSPLTSINFQQTTQLATHTHDSGAHPRPPGAKCTGLPDRPIAKVNRNDETRNADAVLCCSGFEHFIPVSRSRFTYPEIRTLAPSRSMGHARRDTDASDGLTVVARHRSNEATAHVLHYNSSREGCDLSTSMRYRALARSSANAPHRWLGVNLSSSGCSAKRTTPCRPWSHRTKFMRSPDSMGNAE